MEEPEQMNETMAQVEQIKKAVLNLPPPELEAFREWYEDLEAQEWDRQLEEDIQSGKLDELAQEALADFELGLCTEL
jgi:hypothetical protein